MSDIKKFFEICQSKTELLTEDSIKGIDLKTIGCDVLEGVAKAKNIHNWNFLISHGVNDVEWHPSFLDVHHCMKMELLRLCDKISIDKTHDYMNKLNSLITKWKKLEHTDEWKKYLITVISYALSLFIFDVVDILMNEFNSKAMFGYIANTFTVNRERTSVCKKNLKILIEKYYLTGKITKCTSDDIADSSLFKCTDQEVIDYLYELGYVSKEIGIKHFTYSRVYRNNDITNAYMKHGIMESDIDEELSNRLNRYKK